MATVSVAGGGVTASVAVRVDPPQFAERAAFVVAVTALVVTVKLAVVTPAGTVTLTGTVAAALLLPRLTTIPPPGAAALRVTVACAAVPPWTEVGVTARPATETGAVPEVSTA